MPHSSNVSSSPQAQESDSQEDYKLLFGLLGAVIVAWIICAVIVWLVPQQVSVTGPFGDTFGVLNTLFSGLAFAAFIYTVTLQRKELKLQRDELRDTRAELRGQREQMAQQNLTSAQQRFESTLSG